MEFFDVDVDDGGEIQGHDLGEDEASHDHKAKGLSALRCHAAEAKGDGNRSHEGSEGGHEDGADSDKRRVIDGVVDAFAVVNSRFIGKVDEDDPVFEDNAEEEDEADKGVEGKGLAKEDEGDKASKHGGGKGGHDGKWGEEVFIEDAEDDVDEEEGDDKEEVEVGKGGFKDISGPLDEAVNGGGKGFVCDSFDGGKGGVKRSVIEVEGNGGRGQAVDVIDGEGADFFCHFSDGGEGDEAACA